MRKLLTLLTIMFGLGVLNASFAQTTGGKIKGTVKDQGQKAATSATVALLKAKDSTVVKMSATAADGSFSFDGIAEGKYLVMVTAVGAAKTYSPGFDINAVQNAISLNTIQLTASAKSLSGVTVVSKRPMIEQKIDRTIVNVDAAVTNVGSTALEVLEKSPGVTVDKDGNIGLKGKQGVVVMVDGKPSYLSGPDLANLLRAMQASQLDQIEIMTNPSAKYDAAGNAGIINIKTKKNKIKGFNGNVSVGYGQGVYPKTNEGINLNYRNGKLNVFGSYNHSFRKNFQELLILRNFRDKTTKNIVSVFDQNSYIIKENENHSLKLGMDYFANKKTVLGIVLTGFSSPSDENAFTDTDIMNNTGTLQSKTKTFNTTENRWKNFTGNINFKHTFDSTGREITADLDYATYRSAAQQNLNNHYYDKSGSSTFPSDTLLGNLPVMINIYSAKVDYSHPLTKDTKIEAGFKTSFVKTDNNAQYDSLLNNVRVRDIGRSNHFLYEENINAAYVNFNKQLSKKWGLQLGARVENTNAKGTQLTTGEKFNRQYTQLFPTAFVSYAASEKNQFSFSYGRRIERPDYEDMNPFFHFLDRYTYQAGNPNLQPQFSHNIELTHSFRGAITTTLNYTKTTDIIQDVIEQDALKNETFVRKSNIASQDNIGIAVNVYLPLKKWWTINVYTNGYRNHFTGIVNGEPIDVNGVTAVVNMSNQFSLSKGWNAELSGFYRSRGVEGVLIAQPMGQLSFGVTKSVLKKKGTLRLNVRDFLRIQQFRGYARYADVDATIKNRWDNRVVNIGFTYRFGKNTAGQPRKRTTGASAEQGRVKVGE
jgi:iron complex outermembrane recepter protein